MMLKEENKNKNNKKKDKPRELLPLRKEDPRLVRLPRRPEEKDSVVSTHKWKNPSRELMRPGPSKKRNSPSVSRKTRKKKIKNEVFDNVSYINFKSNIKYYHSF